MNTKSFTPNSDMLPLLAMGNYCAYVFDTKAKVHYVSSNADTPEEFMQAIEKEASFRGIDVAHVEIFDPADWK